MIAHETLTPLLDLDPDLGRLLTAERARAARSELGVRMSHIARGVWDAERLAAAHPEHVGLLMIDGVVAREVLIADTISTELLGTGDLVRPWRSSDDERLLTLEVRWTALADARMAILDRRFAARLVHFPEINAVLLDRLTDRAHRVAVSQAICQLNGVNRRLLALFWHLAERWGRMTPQGVAVPMALSHRVLAQLVGARRPTVSTALGELADRGEIVRREDGSWLLLGAPIGIPSLEAGRIVEHRRRLLPREHLHLPAAAQEATMRADRPARRGDEMRMKIERLRHDSALQAQQFKEASEAAAELCRRAGELRIERRDLARPVNGRSVD